MLRVLQIIGLLAALALPAFCQYGRLTAEDQHEFDKAYTKWVNDTRKNDRDDIAKDIRKMQEIMARYNIPANVPYDRIASTGNVSQERSYQRQLPPDDQKEFDKHYTKWVNDNRKNDRDDVEKDARKMQEIMARNGIPASVPFEQIASTGYPSGDQYGNGGSGYNNSGAYPRGSAYGSRLSPEDQREFDRYYGQWVDDTRRDDRDDAARAVEHMEENMARYNIPTNVAFDQVATPGGYQNNGYSGNSYPAGGTPGYGQTRLSSDDQHEFDKAYAKWVSDSRKNDRDDLEKDTRKMQEIMARYNIPSNVPYDQIASPDAAYRH